MQTMAVLRRYAETPFRLTRPDTAQAPFMKEPSQCRLTI